MFRKVDPAIGLRTLVPACLAAIAYVDPGNFAVNLAAGAGHRYTLLWVVLAASVMAALVQYLAAKLGAATSLSLVENTRRSCPRPVRWFLSCQAQLVVLMTDLAELVGGALALSLLFGTPLLVGVVIVAVFSYLILVARFRGHEGFEPVLLSLLGVLVCALGAQAVMTGATLPSVLAGMRPQPLQGSATLLAVGIIGATVMPHAIHFHSAVGRCARTALADDEALARTASRRLAGGIAIAMTVAALANVSLMVIGAHLPTAAADGLTHAHDAIAVAAGRGAATLFALSLLISGLASTVVGVYTGQVVLPGLSTTARALAMRRLAALVPPIGLLALGLDATHALVLSQVALSFALPGTLIPLLWFTTRRPVMGAMANRRSTTVAAAAAITLITVLDGYLLVTAW